MMINPKAIQDTSIPIHDLVHGELKSLMLYAEEQIEASDTDLANYWNGRLDGYADLYKLIYDLIFIREDLDKQ
jgi:hypothetical protein